MNTDTIKDLPIKTLRFPNNNRAVAVLASADTKTEAIVAALNIRDYKAVILVLGGGDTIEASLLPRLTQLFSRGIARAAVEANAVILDGGTQSGVMALMGEGVASRGHRSVLIGVAPESLVTYPGKTAAATPAEPDNTSAETSDEPKNTSPATPLEPNHTHFVLTEGNTWGSETPTMYHLFTELILKRNKPAGTDRKPEKPASEKAIVKASYLAILAGGGPTSRNEVLRAIRNNIPLIVVEGSGGLADEIAAAWKNKESSPEEPEMAEIIADGEIHLHVLSNSVKGMERLIIRELGVDKVLMQAWETFADYDLNANLQQDRFGKLQLWILILGVAGTALAIFQQVYAPKDLKTGNLLLVDYDSAIKRFLNGELAPMAWWALRHLLIVIPILLTVLVTAANRFKQGSKWLLLRAGAESIKREIYRYRTRAMHYKEKSEKQVVKSPEQQLAKSIEDITRRTMRTEVNTSSLKLYDKDQGFPPYMYAAQGGDDGFSFLTPDRYVEVRLGDQLNYFQKRAILHEKKLKALYWLTFIIGGAGAYLAAVNQQVWIALTTALVAAMGTYLGYWQIENTLMKYNQAVTDLGNVKAWWSALSAEEQAREQNIDSLVEHTEQVLQSELDGWVQQMQNALAELRKEQGPPTEKEEKKEPQEPLSPPESEKSKAKPGTDGQPPSANAAPTADVVPVADIAPDSVVETDADTAMTADAETETIAEPETIAEVQEGGNPKEGSDRI